MSPMRFLAADLLSALLLSGCWFFDTEVLRFRRSPGPVRP